MAEYDLNAPTDTIAKQRANTRAFLSGQDAQTNAYLNKLQGYVASQPGVGVMADRIGKELGLPQLRANATQLNNTLTDLPQTYSKAMTGYDVNANQLARVVGTKQAEIAPLAQRATEQAQNAESMVNQRLGYASEDYNRGLLPLTTEGGMLTDRLARETSLYSTDNQRELDAIIAKMNAGITLSEGEKNRAQQLAVAEQNYNLQKEQMNTNSKNSGTQVIDVGNGRKALIDTRTGATIQTYGGTTSSGSSASKYLSTANKSPLSQFIKP